MIFLKVVVVIAHSSSVIAPELFPALFSQAFSGIGAPFDAGRHFIPVYIVAAFAAADAGLIGKYFHLIAAGGAFIKGDLQVSSILSGAMADHMTTSCLDFPRLSTFYDREDGTTMIQVILERKRRGLKYQRQDA
jgi:hypothetical protein